MVNFPDPVYGKMSDYNLKHTKVDVEIKVQETSNNKTFEKKFYNDHLYRINQELSRRDHNKRK